MTGRARNPLLDRLLAPDDGHDGKDVNMAVSENAPNPGDGHRCGHPGGPGHASVSFVEAFPGVDIDLTHLSAHHNRFNCNGHSGHTFDPGLCDEHCTKLDQALWEWEETEQDGKDSAPFTSAGLIASANARFILFIVGLGIVAWFSVVMSTAKGHPSLRDVGSMLVGFIGIGTYLLVWDRTPPSRADFVWLLTYFGIKQHVLERAHVSLCGVVEHEDSEIQSVAPAPLGSKSNRSSNFRQPRAALFLFRFGGIVPFVWFIMAVGCRCSFSSLGGSICIRDVVGLNPYSCAYNCMLVMFTVVLVVLINLYPRKQMYSVLNVCGAVWFCNAIFYAVSSHTEPPSLGLSQTADGILGTTGYLVIALVLWGTALYMRRNRKKAKMRARVILSESVGRYTKAWGKHSHARCTDSTTGAEPGSRMTKVLLERCAALPSATPRQPFDKLAELYRYSTVVNVWFQHKCRRWMDELGMPHDRVKRYQWVHVKTVARAIEKVRRAYFGVVHRLTDVVRGSIVVDNLDEVHSALQLVIHDKQVTIVRVKCGFASTEEEAATRGGYRDLQLLVRCDGFDFNDFKDIGVNYPASAAAEDGIDRELCTLVLCEVQIHVRDLYEVKNTVSHQSYAKARTILGN